jgi:hypothetical protein
MPEDITNNLYTSGGEFQTEDGVEYRGAYHRYTTNEIYTGATWNATTSKKLVLLERMQNRDLVYAKLKRQLQTKFITPRAVKPSPTQSDYKSGYIDRYFLKKCNEPVFIEIDSAQQRLWSRGVIDRALYKSITLRWFISGNIEDVNTGNSLQRGVITKNTIAVQFAQQELPGIADILTDPLQYYADSEFTAPADINS